MRSAALDEKHAGLAALSNIIENAGLKFFPYLNKTMFIVKSLADYPHPVVRENVLGVYNGL